MAAMLLRRLPLLAARSPLRRGIAQAAGPKRPRAVRVKQSDARRSVPERERERQARDALVEAPRAEAPAPHFPPAEAPQGPQTFGGVMKESFLWGIGMTLAFAFVGVVFSSMEQTQAPGAFGASAVVIGEDEDEDE